jgi:iron-sulfur cluster repair protein YtfE (RIC family)
MTAMTDHFTPEETMTFPELAPGRKDDASKTLAGLLKDFAPALLDVAEVGTFGAKKYARGNWLKVDNGLERYEDALWRHLLQHGKDPESGLDHRAHAAWNLLALITLYHKEKQQ